MAGTHLVKHVRPLHVSFPTTTIEGWAWWVGAACVWGGALFVRGRNNAAART